MRFWVFLGILLSILPLLASSAGVYIVLSRGVVADFQDVAARQRDQVVPLQHLQVELWEASTTFERYLESRDAPEVRQYRALREQIESDFASLHRALAAEPDAADLISRARTSWTDADAASTRMFAVNGGHQAPEAIAAAREFDASIGRAVDILAGVYEQIRRDLEDDHVQALRSYDRSEWIAGIAAVVSLLMMAAGTFVIGRFLLASVDRLVEGAERFSSGDRDHRIEIRVPPELHKVAEEFNYMIGRIRESEAAMVDLARKDPLTGTLNRRALDEILPERLAQQQRTREDVALLMIDIDHFKRVNDTHGHAAGDETLRVIAETIARNIRVVDRLFRFGGEEFVLLLHRADLAAAREKAEQVRAAVAAVPIAVANRSLAVTVSVGVAASHGSITSDALIAQADAALYQAKAEGRNRVAVAPARDGVAVS
jgi:diguanylate cyclase (GGDEF)-like protein